MTAAGSSAWDRRSRPRTAPDRRRRRGASSPPRRAGAGRRRTGPAPRATPARSPVGSPAGCGDSGEPDMVTAPSSPCSAAALPVATRRAPRPPRYPRALDRLSAMASATTRPAEGERGDAYGPIGRSPWLDVDWRRHQRWIGLGGRPVNVIEMGEGPPLIFVHGLAGSWQNWLEQLPVFAADHRVIALDLPGFGYSPMPAEKISISGYARTIGELCEPWTSRPPPWWATRWAASSRPSWPSRPRAGRRAWCWCRRPASASRTSAIPPTRCAGSRASSPAIPRGWRASPRRRTPSAPAPGDAVQRHAPSRAAARAAGRRAAARLGQARFHRRPRGADHLPDPRAPGQDRLPQPVVWGDSDRLVPTATPMCSKS